MLRCQVPDADVHARAGTYCFCVHCSTDLRCACVYLLLCMHVRCEHWVLHLAECRQGQTRTEMERERHERGGRQAKQP